MDYNNSTFENITDSHVVVTYLPYWAVILRDVISCLISIIGIIGNCMIILAVAFSRKLQTSTNVFVTSLATTDLLNCLSVPLAYSIAVTSLSPTPRNKICQFSGFVAYSSVGVSLYTLGAIGINRLILITNSKLFRRIFTPCKLGIFVAMSWIIPSGSFLMALIWEFGAVGFNPVKKECGIIDSHERAADLNLAMLAVFFPIPFVAVIVSYSWIYMHVKKHFKKQKQNLVNLRAASPAGSGNSSPLFRPQVCNNEAENPRLNEISRQQIQITKNLFLVVCAFFIGFVPINIINFIVLVSDPLPTVNALRQYVILLAFASSALNFFIYASKHPDFKIVLGHMMRCSYSKIPQPSRLLKLLLSKNN